MLTLKYRPKILSDVVGQKHITKVLQRIVDRDTLPHSLIFSGPRGTGKTTIARILGAMLNCESPLSKPCGTCPSCIDIFESRSTAVLEIDSATSGLVDDVKSILNNLRFASSAKQVTLFDEAHAISKQGFQALLKTVEDGASTVFIFVTTEPSKIPLTIQSRSMPFEFNAISPADIADRLRQILILEDIPYDEDAIRFIVRQSTGALRDGIMLIDQLFRGFGEVSRGSFCAAFGDDIALVFIQLINALYLFDVTSIDTAVDVALLRVSDPLEVVELWIDFELSLLKEHQYVFNNPQPESDILARLEILWFLTDKLKVLGRTRALLRVAAVLMSARVTRRILSSEEAFALLSA